MTDLGRFIAHKRREKGFSQDDMGELLGYTRYNICLLERGKIKDPKPDVLRQIARILEIPYIQLLVEAGYLQNGDLDDLDVEAITE